MSSIWKRKSYKNHNVMDKIKGWHENSEMENISWKNLPEIYPMRHRVGKEIKSKKIRSRTFNTYIIEVLEEEKRKRKRSTISGHIR